MVIMGDERPEAPDFPLPHSLLADEDWPDTGELDPELNGASGSRKVKASVTKRSGSRKPGQPVQGSVEAMREIVAVRIAKWLSVSVPHGELLAFEGRHPCFISHHVGPTAHKWQTVMVDPVGQALRAIATSALDALVPVIVLDALVGALDRANTGNYVYVPQENRWYSIDYTQSFNTSAASGTGSQGTFVTPYHAEMIAAARGQQQAIEATLQLAESIPDAAFDRLLALIPDLFGSKDARDQAGSFLKHRRSNLRQILQEWCKMVGLPGIIKDANS